MQAISKAISIVGSQSALANGLGVTQPTISEWVNGKRPVPIGRCAQIETMTSGAVRRWDLRPSDWHRIWPELIGQPGAPVIPTPAANDTPSAEAA